MVDMITDVGGFDGALQRGGERVSVVMWKGQKGVFPTGPPSALM